MIYGLRFRIHNLKGCTFLAAISLLITLVGVPAYAQEKIGLQQAIELGVKNNPMLKMSTAKIQLAEARLSEMKEQRLPHAGASLAYSHFQLLTPFALKFGSAPKPLFVIPSTGFDATIGSVSVAEEIFSGFRVQSSIKSSEYLVQAAKMDADKDKTDLSYTITAAFYNIYKIMKSSEIIDENLKVLDEKIREVSSLEKQGVVIHNDVLKVKLQRSNLELSRLEVVSAKSNAMYNLKLMTGLAENTEYDIDTNGLFNNSPQGALADLQNQALSTRAELKTNALRAKSVDYNIKAIQSSKYPSLGVGLNYYYINPGSGIIPEKDAFINAGGIGVNLAYNISSLYANKGKLDEAKANLAQLSSANEMQVNMIKSEVYSNFNNWNLAKEKITVAQLAIDQSTENYRTTDSRYKNSAATMTDLMDANSLLLQAKLNKINAVTDTRLSYFKLINSTGK
jgi:outer membrane protein